MALMPPTIDPPRVIRVRTSTGWADLTVVGPAGPTGPAGTPGAAGAAGPTGPAGAAGVVPAPGYVAETGAIAANTDFALPTPGAQITTLRSGVGGGSVRSIAQAPGGTQLDLQLWAGATATTLKHVSSGVPAGYAPLYLESQADTLLPPGSVAHLTSLGTGYWIVTGITASAASPGIGTAFPPSPIDGQEFVLVDSLTAPTFAWRFKYVPSLTSYKWLYIGGSPRRSTGGSMTLATTQTAPIDVTGGPSILIPRDGLYRFNYGADIGNAGTFAGAYRTIAQLYVGSTAMGQPLQIAHHPGQYMGAMVTTFSEPGVLVSGWTLNLKTWMDRVGSNSTVSQCWIDCVPVRVS